MAYIDIFNLKANPEMKSRVAVAVAKAATDILNEAPATPNHTERVAWANVALVGAEDVAEQMLWSIVQNATIQAAGLDSTDNDIQFVVNSFIDLFALNIS